MINRFVAAVATLLLANGAIAADWVEGKHYVRIDPVIATPSPDKIDVVEVFSYGCPHCNDFQPLAASIRKGLPANAQMRYVPADFGRSAWSTFARAFHAADALGIVESTHAPLFDAIYKTKSVDLTAPTLEQIAAVYASAAKVKAEDVLAVAQSFSVNTRMKRADAWVKAAGVDATPTFIVNGKYRVVSSEAGGLPQLIELVQYLVVKEGGK
jgi:thiol:disulfide interchange protein DsbA